MATPDMTFSDELANWKGWDETLSLELPDTDPDMNQPDPKTPPPEAPARRKQTMAELMDIIDAKVRLAAIDTRKHFLGSLYAHLQFTEIDWTFEGLYVCRAVGLECHGLDLHSRLDLAAHLQNGVHLHHEEKLSAEWVWVEPASETAVVDDGDEEAPPKPTFFGRLTSG